MLTVFRMAHKTPEEVDGERVREAIRSAGLSDRQAAERSGIPPVTLNRKLRGHAAFNSTELRKLAHVLGVAASSLITEEVAA